MKKINLYSLSLVLSCAILSGCSDDTSTAASVNGDGDSPGGDLGPSTQTGIVTHRDFQILYDPVPAEIFDDEGAYIQTPITLSIHADDINDLVVNGRTVNFATEWGTFTGESRDSCVLEDGRCEVIWLPGHKATAPADCLVSFTAWTVGEEKFADINNNGLFDVGELFVDLEEPYLDIDADTYANYSVSSYDIACNDDYVCEAIDIVNFTRDTPDTTNGMHDPADGIYNGSLCANASGNPACLSSATSTMIHTRSILRIQEPFDHDENDATPDVVICNF